MASVIHETFANIKKSCTLFITGVCKFFSFLCHYFVAIAEMINIAGLFTNITIFK